MSVDRSGSPLIVGGPAIARYMGVSLHTLYRWIEQEAFPAGKVYKGRWTTTPSLIDAWILSRGFAIQPTKDRTARQEAQRLKWKAARQRRNKRIAAALALFPDVPLTPIEEQSLAREPKD